MEPVKENVPERIGIYGGTFDPIHVGHLQVASAICEAFALDRFLFVPAFIPPHKRGRRISAPHHRYAMAVLATLAHPNMSVSTIELEAPTRPYTIETLQALQTLYPKAKLFFVMGGDSFAEVHLWRAYEQLLTEFNIIVAGRPNADSFTLQYLTPLCRQRVVDLRASKRPELSQGDEAHVFLTDYVAVDVSATQVRSAVQDGLSIETLVTGEVASYIQKYELYRNDN